MKIFSNSRAFTEFRADTLSMPIKCRYKCWILFYFAQNKTKQVNWSQNRLILISDNTERKRKTLKKKPYIRTPQVQESITKEEQTTIAANTKQKEKVICFHFTRWIWFQSLFRQTSHKEKKNRKKKKNYVKF